MSQRFNTSGQCEPTPIRYAAGKVTLEFGLSGAGYIAVSTIDFGDISGSGTNDFWLPLAIDNVRVGLLRFQFACIKDGQALYRAVEWRAVNSRSAAADEATPNSNARAIIIERQPASTPQSVLTFEQQLRAALHIVAVNNPLIAARSKALLLGAFDHPLLNQWTDAHDWVLLAITIVTAVLGGHVPLPRIAPIEVDARGDLLVVGGQ